MSVKQYLIDASTRHQVFLQRYAGGEAKKAINTLNRLRRDINSRLAQEPSDFQKARLSLVLEDLNKLSAAAYGTISSQLELSLKNLALDEADFSATLYGKTANVSFGTPAEAALIASVENIPMNAPKGGATITVAQALKDFSAKKANQINQVILDGVTLGKTTAEISSEVSSMMNTLQRRQIDALVRTATNHASSVARTEVYKHNQHLLDGYQWVSTLDARTTMICASRDGRTYEIDSGIMPPAHWGCRSTTIPAVKEEFTLAKGMKGERPQVGAKGKGAISANTNYGTWLRKQPKEFVDEALGVERSKLFRSGKLTIEKFVDPTGRVYTLDQLRAMHPFAFQEF